MDDREFRLYLKIDVTELDLWVEQGWLAPDISEGRRRFRDADLARARLILDLTRQMGVNEAGVDVVMELVDQLHGMRGAMRRLVVAINRQEAEIQKRLLDALEELDDSAR
ncbi:chaperone modulator CbpM [Rhizobium sp. 1399]|jgi:chaperone modulatory protein CbpM|uniref:chaperone modulator CbpM n=1 Tax=Rhizobium sp. 1399 TaxID=2817758 RepID=UPI002857337C|nr:chaperone modulator CbpM [Rhizobium sp. 1399]MDR6671162.1 chaperone modulatory protein CbpM [Rhizobium sp. 1399]